MTERKFFEADHLGWFRVCHSVDQMLDQIARPGIPLQNHRAGA